MPRLLIVDDQVTISINLEVLLRSMGHDVVGVASSGKKAVEMARSLNPDLILMDVVMPGELDGIEAADKIRSDLDIPIIFISGYSEEGLVDRAKHVEPFGYLLKPFQEDQLKVAIDIAMYKKDMDRQLQKAHDELDQKVEERTAELLQLNEQLRQEIAERQQAEASLRESEARARALLNAPSDSALLLDLEGTVLAANKIAAKRLGKRVSQLLDMCVYDLFPSALVKSRRAKADQVISSGNPRRFKDERAGMILDSTIYPVFDEGGKVVQLAIYGKDITKERKALQDLKKREKELEARTRSLEEANTALSVLLRRREEDKTDLEGKVLSNIKTLVRPNIEKLKKTQVNTEQKAYLSALELSLENIISSFVRGLSSTILDLTPMEIRVASLVREGKSNKEIAELLSLSKNTILTHRSNLRRKLGIKNKKVNLRSHLLSFH